jgi:hypothetical protein
MLRIVAVGAVLIAVMFAVKDYRLLQRSHVVGSCAMVAEVTDGSEWRSCVAGRLTDRPGLSMDGCTDYGLYLEAEYWHCPAALAGSAIGQ